MLLLIKEMIVNINIMQREEKLECFMNVLSQIKM